MYVRVYMYVYLYVRVYMYVCMHVWSLPCSRCRSWLGEWAGPVASRRPGRSY